MNIYSIECNRWEWGAECTCKWERNNWYILYLYDTQIKSNANITVLGYDIYTILFYIHLFYIFLIYTTTKCRITILFCTIFLRNTKTDEKHKNGGLFVTSLWNLCWCLLFSFAFSLCVLSKERSFTFSGSLARNEQWSKIKTYIYIILNEYIGYFRIFLYLCLYSIFQVECRRFAIFLNRFGVICGNPYEFCD